MCGIVGYIGNREAYPIVLKGLKRLEYRGYDSTGVAIIQDGKLQVHKKKGKVIELEDAVVGINMHSNVCIGHTRWATHGAPSEENAHPHGSHEQIYIVHNGIIENSDEIKRELISKGLKFKSQTDTEVITLLITESLKENEPLKSVYKALKKLLDVNNSLLNKKIPGEPYTVSNAIRVYIWGLQGMKVPGLSKADAKILNDYVLDNENLQLFANNLIDINKDNGYAKPSEGWLAGTITTDLLSGLNTVVRAKYLKQWQGNVNEVFNESHPRA